MSTGRTGRIRNLPCFAHRVSFLAVAIATVALAACGEEEGCGSGDVCGPDTFARAIIHGQVFQFDGETVPNLQIYTACEHIDGLYDTQTDAEGRFTVRPAYAPAEPLDDAEVLVIPCAIWSEPDTLLGGGEVWVPFYPRSMPVEPVHATFTYEEAGS